MAPLIGAAIYLLKNQKFSVEGLVLAYPIAMFPLGFWAALIAALATPLMFYLKEKFGRIVLMFVAGISGALIGSVFMLVFVRIGAWIQVNTSCRSLVLFDLWLNGWIDYSSFGRLAYRADG